MGASEAATACGISTYCLPYSFYDHLIGLMDGGDEENTETEATIHGHVCEPLVTEIYERVTGYKTEEANYWESNEQPDWWGCSPDRKVYINGVFAGLLEDKALVEIFFGLEKLQALLATSADSVTQLVERRIDRSAITDPQSGESITLLSAYSSDRVDGAQRNPGDLMGYGFAVSGLGFWARIDGVMAVTPDLKTAKGIYF